MSEQSPKKEKELVLMEKYKDYIKIHQYLFHEEPEYFSTFISHPDNNFQRNLNVLMRDLVNRAFGNEPHHDPYSTYLHVSTPRSMAGLAEWVVGPHQTLMYFNKEYALSFEDENAEDYGLCAIAQVTGMQQYQYGHWYRCCELLLPPQLLSEERMPSLLRCITSDMIARNIKSKSRIPLLRLSINVPTLVADNKKVKVIPVPKVTVAGIESVPNVTMGTLVRSQKDTDVMNRWEDECDPYGIQIIGLRPSDAYNMPDAAVNLVSSMFMFFDRQQYKSHNLNRIKINKEDAIKEARRYLYYEFMNSRNTTLLFLIDHNPIGMLEYACYQGGPIHINKFFLLKEFRKHGYGTWIMKKVLSDTYSIEPCLPYQTLKIYGSSAPKLLPFYGKFGFSPAYIEGELTLQDEQVKDLQNQLN